MIQIIHDLCTNTISTYIQDVEDSPYPKKEEVVNKNG
jgi:ketopantoate hydroxymethyltransferase